VRLPGDESTPQESFSSHPSAFFEEQKRGGLDAPSDNARNSATLHPATGGSYVFNFELRGGEYFGTAYTLIGRPAEIEKGAAIRDWSDPGL